VRASVEVPIARAMSAIFMERLILGLSRRVNARFRAAIPDGDTV